MAARKNWVPTHSIIVVRDGKQVDAYDEYKKTGKAFTFTDDEVKQITDLDTASLRSPTDEAPDTDRVSPVVSPGTDDAPVAGASDVAQTDDAKAASKGKDEDL